MIKMHNTGHALPNKTYLIDSFEGLIDNATLKYHPNNRRTCNSGNHKWPKAFLGGVYKMLIWEEYIWYLTKTTCLYP